MAELVSFLIFISAGLFLSEFFRKFNVPYVVSLILAGMLIGPYGFGILEVDTTIDFLAQIGLVFLMFMAGLEIKLSGLAKYWRNIAKISTLNGLFPFAVGFFIAGFFGYDIIASSLMGIIFMSSSIAVVVPALENKGLLKTPLGKTIVGSTIIKDVLSLFAFSFLLQNIAPTTSIPLHFFYFVVLGSMIAIKLSLPKARTLLMMDREGKFEEEVRFVFASLIAVVIFFDALGLHAIIAGFFAGLVMADSIKSRQLKQKLHAISYGLFIPAFFIVVGTKTDLQAIGQASGAIPFVLAIVGGTILAKFASGWIAGRFSGFDKLQSTLIGVSEIPQLSTTLAIVFIGLEMGILDAEISAAMVLLSIATTFMGSLGISIIADRYSAKRLNKQVG